MQTPKISKVQIQDTPIASIRLEWWEDNTYHAADVPTAWALRLYTSFPVTDSDVSNKKLLHALVSDIFAYFTEWIVSIRLNFPEHIATLEVSDNTIPAIFESAAT